MQPGKLNKTDGSDAWRYTIVSFNAQFGLWYLDTAADNSVQKKSAFVCERVTTVNSAPFCSRRAAGYLSVVQTNTFKETGTF